MFPSRKFRGFSLIELMCSMVIGSIILLAAAFLLGSAGEVYEEVGGGVAAEREARALISRLTSDLSNARFHKEGVMRMSSAIRPAVRLGFLSLQPPRAQSEAGRVGDLCAVSYHIKDLTIGGKTVRCVMRGFRESSEVFKALEAREMAPLFAERESSDEPVAFGVVSFGAWPKSRDKAGRWQAWGGNDDIGPEALEVRVVIARRGFAGRLKLPEDWDAAESSFGLSGPPGEAEGNKELGVYSALIRFGNDANL